MKQSTNIDRDYAFGQTMLTLRTAIGLTQADLAGALGVSRRAIGDWEAGSSYPKAEHLKQFIALAVERQAFPAGREADEIRALWQAAHQKIQLDEAWLTALLPATELLKEIGTAHTLAPPVVHGHLTNGDQTVAIALPFQPTPFIGRVAELTELARMLGDPACRLLTLLGPGGVGKTRLALAVAAAQTDTFTDGVAFVALASVGTSSQIVSAVGDVLKLSFAGLPDPTPHLLDHLRERQMLLVLDNFEHLSEGADLVNGIIEHAPHVTILVTSRARLNLQTEWLFDVEGLAFPQLDSQGSFAPHPHTNLTDYSAIQLFVQRATQVQPRLSLTEATLATIGRICQHVAGMPLAIELAAAGARTLPIAEIERQIHFNLDVLTTARRDVPARHRSMRAVFDHSWSLLSEPERALLSRLAVFRGSWTATAAEQVAEATLPALTMLVDKSLLRQTNATTWSLGDRNMPNVTVEPLFALLEPIREYAFEQLMARGEAETLQGAHAAYYLALAEAAEAHWDSPTADVAIEQLDREHDNIRAALRWARDGGDLAIGLRLAGALRKFWRRRGQLSEGRAWLADLLSRHDADPVATQAARAHALSAAGWLASYQHDFQHAAQLFEQSMALRRALGQTEDETNLLLNAATEARATGQYQRATGLLEDALARQRALGNRGSLSSNGLGMTLFLLGLVQREQGDFAQAEALFHESVAFHREIEDREGEAAGLLALSDIARDHGDASQVRANCEESLVVFQKLGVQWAIGFSLNNLALAAYLEGDLTRTLALISESVTLFRNQKADGSLSEVLITLGRIELARGNGTAAYDALTEALRLALNVGPRLFVSSAVEELVHVLIQSEHTALAVQLLGAASALRTRMGTPVRPADQAAVARALATAQATLSADAFAAAWSEGSDIQLEHLAGILPKQLRLSQPASLSQPTSGPRVDWGDALAVPSFYGREWEINLLIEWVVEERCRVVSLLGLGGIGKSALAVSLMHHIAKQFDVVIWRSLRDLPSCDALLDDLLQVLSPQALGEPNASLERRQGLLLEHMRSSRVLLVLDNLESVLEEGDGSGRMRPGYEGFGRFLRFSSQTEHQSCVLLTSREKPSDLVSQEGSRSPVRALRLARLDAEACEQLLAERDVVGSSAKRARLIEAYAGNPLALKIVVQTIVELYDGAIAPFLEQGEIIFGGIRELLAEQFNRLSTLEQCVLLWLAILREPATLDELMALLVTTVPRAQLLEAIEALRRRSLIERGQRQGSFTLQSVVLEYATARLVADAGAEIEQSRMVCLIEHGLELAHAREYVRQTQERLIVAPILAHLRSRYTQQDALGKHLLALLAELTTREPQAQGYGPANLVTLLRSQRGDLRGLDLSRLALRSVHLRGVEMQDAGLSGALIQDSVFTEAFDIVTAVAVSKTGTYWAATSRRGEVRVWEAGGQTLYRAWRAHTDMVWALEFSSDGCTLASGSWDGAVKLWDVASGSLLWSGRHTSHINRVVFSPHGRILASGGNDATVQLWDALSGTLLQTLSHPEAVTSIAWSPDGRLIATGDLKGRIRLWSVSETEPATCILILAEHTNCVEGLAFSSDGSILASASWDSTVKLWVVASGRLHETLVRHTDRAFRVAWSPDGLTLATGGRDQTIWLWDAKQSSYRAVLRGHDSGVSGLSFTPDGQSLVSGSEDGTLRVWDMTNGQCTRVIQGYADSLHDVDWSPDGTQLVSGSTDYLVTVYAANGETPPRTLLGHTGVVYGVRWSPDGQWLASSEWDNAIRIWDPASGAGRRVLLNPDDPGSYIYGLDWSPDGRRLAGGTYKRGVQVWDVMMHRQSLSEQEFPTWIRHVAWSPDGQRLAGGGDDGIVYVWDADNGTLLQRLTGHQSMVMGMAWSPDGTRLAYSNRGMQGGELFIWDLLQEERVHTFAAHSWIDAAVAWGASRDLLISGGDDGKLRWWDVKHGTCVRVSEAHLGTVQSLRRSPDGTKLASCGDDGAIMIWDLHSGEHLQTLRRDRPYERLNITGIKGLTEAQKATLRALGAVEDAA